MKEDYETSIVGKLYQSAKDVAQKTGQLGILTTALVAPIFFGGCATVNPNQTSEGREAVSNIRFAHGHGQRINGISPSNRHNYTALPGPLVKLSDLGVEAADPNNRSDYFSGGFLSRAVYKAGLVNPNIRYALAAHEGDSSSYFILQLPAWDTDGNGDLSSSNLIYAVRNFKGVALIHYVTEVKDDGDNLIDYIILGTHRIVAVQDLDGIKSGLETALGEGHIMAPAKKGGMFSEALPVRVIRLPNVDETTK